MQTSKLVVALAFLSAATCVATTASAAETRVALVIGNEEYQDAGHLRNPIHDADIIAAALKRANFQVDEEKNLTNEGLRRSLLNFSDVTQSSDVAVVYYAGHGVHVGDDDYLIPVDAKQSQMSNPGLAMVPLQLLISAVKSKRFRLIFMDACRDNPFAKASVAAGTRSYEISRGLVPVDRDVLGDVVIAFSASEGKLADDGSGDNSPYAEAVARHLDERGTELGVFFVEVNKDVRERTRDAQVPNEQDEGRAALFYFVPTDDSAAILRHGDWSGHLRNAGLIRAAYAPEILRRAPAYRGWAAHESDPTRQLLELAQAEASAAVVPPAPAATFADCPDVCPVMVKLPKGDFSMGSPAGELGRFPDEGPLHRVTIAYDLAVGEFDVTFAQWDACVAAGGCNGYWPDDHGWGRDNRPVIDVSWADASAYAKWLSQKTGKAYRLLTESEWEYAARAGTSTAYYWGIAADHDFANYGTDRCCDGLAMGKDQWLYTSPVGSFASNGFGLYDMAGNVYQWVEDCYQPNYAEAPTDGSAVDTGICQKRVLRGGSWYNFPQILRSANRIARTPINRENYVGFRVARTL